MYQEQISHENDRDVEKNRKSKALGLAFKLAVLAGGVVCSHIGKVCT
jgi:hypothetical protein